jgi:PH domain
MVIPCGIAAAAQAAAATGSAGATSLGLAMGKSDLDLTRDLFKLQMRQAKRLWTADWAEASVRHGEQCLQSAQQHQEAQAMATAAYYQAEKIAAQGYKLARDQDSRAYEISWRSEVRESLRDELQNQNNRFNIIMLCDTVCLSCVFSLVAEGSPPEDTSLVLLNIYVFSLGLSITLFSISLWCSVIVVRRLHEHTASTLERKLFAHSEDLRKAWQTQVDQRLPTGPQEMHLVNQAYDKWISEYINPLGNVSIHFMSVGVVAMFVTAGLLTHVRYLIEYMAPSAVIIFWSMVIITSSTVVLMKVNEDKMEKRKEAVYDIAWQDQANWETGPCAKILKAADELFSTIAVNLGSTERVQAMGVQEQGERDLCINTKSLHHRVESLRHDSTSRAKTRQEILQLLTTAAEELDALPEELTSQLNKILHDIDEADHRTASLVTLEPEHMLTMEASTRDWRQFSRRIPKAAMALDPIDAQRIPVFLPSIRKKLGEISITTLLRFKNLSDEPLRLKSGLQLKSGKYIQSLNTTNAHGDSVCHQLYPVSEIPPRTEVVVAARSGGGWVPTSGIEGEIVYTNRDETWAFKTTFRNELIKNRRRCQAQASHLGGSGMSDSEHDVSEQDQYWKVSREELDGKANNEIIITIGVSRGDEAVKAARLSERSLKAGFLLKNKPFGLRMHWQPRWFELTPTDLSYSINDAASTQKRQAIAIKDITAVRPGSDLIQKNVFEIHLKGHEPLKLSAASPTERDDWIRKILAAAGVGLDLSAMEAMNRTSEDSTTTAFTPVDGIECYHSDMGTEVLDI